MVTASFKEGQKTAITTSLQKYDYGEVLRIKGLSLPRYVAVQFAVDGMSEALPSSIGETVEDVTDVLIPNSLLRSNIKPWNYNIMAYVYIVSGSSGKTEYTITIPVKWRPKTGDDQAADDDVAAVIGSAVEKMNTATTKAENAANQASATAEEIKADREKITTNEAEISGLMSDLNNYILDVNEFKYTSAETYTGDYWRIPKESDQLIKDCEYIIRIMPSESFHLDVLQIGTNSAKEYMVDTIATGIEFISGKLSEFKYSPSINNLCFIRTLSASSKIASIDFYNIVKKNKLTPQVEANTLNIENIEENIGDLYSYDKIKYTEATLFNVNWWKIGNSYPQLQEGIEYIIEIEASEEFTMSNGTFQIGATGSSDKMVDTIAEEITFKKGFATIKYTPSQNGLCYIRFLGNGNKVISLKFYIIEKSIKDIKELKSKVENANRKVESLECLEPFTYQSSKICESLKEIRQLKNNIDETLSSVMLVKNQEGIEKRLTVHGTKSKILPISLHYESKKYSDTDRDIFFDGACNIDFSDVRFFDESGKMLNVILGKSVNLDILPDDAMDDMIKITSTGYIISFSKNTGISISKDNGKTFERLAYSQNFAEEESDAYHYRSLKPIYVDSSDNIFAYAGGKLYKLYANTEYINYKEVLDYTWIDDNGITHYPDIQNHAMDISKTGVLFVGACYSKEYHVSIYRSTDGGETFSLTWHDWSGSNYQHVHHIHADKYSNKVYVGVDDGSVTWNGAHILVTSDNGDTWNEVATERNIRGKDYYPTYFGENYKLGGAESYIMGSATIYRSEDDSNFDMPVLGLAGVRSFSDFGDDSLIICGSQSNSGCTENHIFISEDKGKTWESIYTKYQEFSVNSGVGYRDIQPVVTLAGDTEPCIAISKDNGKVPSVRIYRGGNHYYRQAFILLDEATDEDITIVAKTGYMIPYTQKRPYGTIHEGLVYEISLSEGYGRYVKDSRGVIAKIEGNDFQWSNIESSRYGDYAGKSTYETYYPYNGLKLNGNTMLEFSAYDKLNFDRNYTISLWVNMDAIGLSYDSSNYRKIGNIRHLLTIGGATFIMHSSNDIGVFDSSQEITQKNYSNGILKKLGKRHSSGSGMIFSKDQFFNVVIVIDKNKKCYVYNNGCEYKIDWNNLESEGWGNLSISEIRLGNPWGIDNCGYISDVKIFNRAMSSDEVLEMYRGN